MYVVYYCKDKPKKNKLDKQGLKKLKVLFFTMFAAYLMGLNSLRYSNKAVKCKNQEHTFIYKKKGPPEIISFHWK